MTTIAYDGKTLVADRQCTHESTGRRSELTKVFKLENNDCFQAIGFSGNPDCIPRVLRGLEQNDYDWETNEIKFVALLIDWAGTAWLVEEEGEVCEVPTPWSIGSGSAFAHGAMEADCTAQEAVKIASNLDMYTGRGFDEIEIN